MKTAVLVAPRTLEIQERPMPVPAPGEVRIQVAAVGVCGSDVHYYEHGRIGSQVVQYPTLLGHEPAGIIDAVGDGVKLPVGMRVAVEPAVPCGTCPPCQEGRGNICPQVRFLGTPPIEGIFAEYHCMPAHACLPIPDSMSLIEAALLEPFGVGLHAVALAGMQVGDTVAIFGAGPIGLVTLLAARAAGAGAVYMTDLVPERLQMAMHLGADGVFPARDGDPVAWVRERTAGMGADITFEAAGVQETVRQACLAARVGGQAVLIGIPQEDELAIPMHECRRRELCIRHVRRSNREADRCLDMVAAGRIPLRPLATHTFPLTDVEAAFDLVQGYGEGVIRAMILPHGDLG